MSDTIEKNAGAPAGPDANLLAEIENLQLQSRQAAHGALAGMHRSLRHGTSIEFSEHKLYTPGDNIRHIDWRAYAKTDRFHIKQFEDETNLSVELLVDHSRSMAFQSAPAGHLLGQDPWPTKLDYARVLAGALGYLALRQGDATGLLTFAAQVTDELPARASSSHLMEVLSRLASIEASGTTGIVESIDHFAQTRRRRTVTIIFTDLFDPNPALWDGIRRLGARRHDVAVMHILDPAETEFPYENPSTFVSLEDDRQLFVHPRTLRNAYVTEMKRFLDETSRKMAESGIDYRVIETRRSPGNVLGEFLRSREAGR